MNADSHSTPITILDDPYAPFTTEQERATKFWSEAVHSFADALVGYFCQRVSEAEVARCYEFLPHRFSARIPFEREAGNVATAVRKVPNPCSSLDPQELVEQGYHVTASMSHGGRLEVSVEPRVAHSDSPASRMRVAVDLASRADEGTYLLLKTEPDFPDFRVVSDFKQPPSVPANRAERRKAARQKRVPTKGITR